MRDRPAARLASHSVRRHRRLGQEVAVNAPLAEATAASPDYKAKSAGVLPPRRLEAGADFGRARRRAARHRDHGLGWRRPAGDSDGQLPGHRCAQVGKDGRWSRTQIAAGNPDPWPKSGSSDVAAGHLGQRRFLCALEPWHGNQVVVYRESAKGWERMVIDDSFTPRTPCWPRSQWRRPRRDRRRLPGRAGAPTSTPRTTPKGATGPGRSRSEDARRGLRARGPEWGRPARPALHRRLEPEVVREPGGRALKPPDTKAAGAAAQAPPVW